MKTYEHIRRALAGKLWYLHEPKLNEMLSFLELKFAGGTVSPEIVAEIREANRVRGNRAMQLLPIVAYNDYDDEPSAPKSRVNTVSSAKSGAVAVIPVYGMIMHRGSMMSDISGGGGASIEGLRQDLRAAVNNPSVKAIVLDVDSPGGDVDGVEEFAQEIYEARKQKKISAVSNCLCASAAYYLASQASDMVVSPSSLTGSIGVYTVHADYSKNDEMNGVRCTLIKFGENKAEGIDFEPLSDSAREHMQEMVDGFGAMFEKAVARGRGVKQDDVHKKFGQGRIFDARQAVKLGMADRVGTLDDVLQGYGVSRNPSAAASADHPVQVSASIAKKSDVGEPDEDENDQAADDPNDDSPCACACPECKGEDCKACSCKDCACSGCACDMAARARNNMKSAMQRRRIELELAAAD